MVIPYIPDVIQAIATRVSASFEARDTDPFPCYYDKGLIRQVARSVAANWNGGVLIWMVYKFSEDFGKSAATLENISFQIVIAVPTDNKYTQQEREDINYKPRLLPVAMEIVKEIERDEWFDIGYEGVKYQRLIAPYSAMGAVNGQDEDGLLEKKLDTIFLNFTDLTVKKLDCAPEGEYYINDTTIYPPLPGTLTFYDDIELIVGAGGQYDPVDGDSSIIIDFLLGKEFEVEQRAIGQLRRRKQVEIIPDEVNGGFALTDGQTFKDGTTFIIKIKPQYIN